MRVISDFHQLGTMVGQEMAVGDWFMVDQARIDAFANATNDHQWIHVDPARAARESPFKTTIAHGFLTLSLLPYLVDQALRIEGPRLVVNYGINRVRFPGPVKSGTRIRVQVKLDAFKQIPGGAEIEWRLNVEREGEVKLGCAATVVIRCFD